MSDANSYWYCPTCDEKLDGEAVTFEELHDPKHGGCGFKVESRSRTPNRPPSCDKLKPKLKECPLCGDAPECTREGSCIEIWCCLLLSDQKSDCLTIQERQTWDADKHQYSVESERKCWNIISEQWNSIPRRSEVAELLRLVDDYYDVLKNLTNKGEKMSDECLLKGIRQGESGCFSEDMKQAICSLTRLVETTNKLRKEWKL